MRKWSTWPRNLFRVVFTGIDPDSCCQIRTNTVRGVLAKSLMLRIAALQRTIIVTPCTKRVIAKIHRFEDCWREEKNAFLKAFMQRLVK
jgi:hypothetical protein